MTLPFIVILLLAFSMSSVVSQLGTSAYVANNVLGMLNPAFLAAATFLICAVMSFATGTSVGTLMVLTPLAVPIAMEMGLSVPLVTSAVLGSIFGDNCSPISDSTAITAAATECDPIKHVQTQLPYSLTFAAISLILYLVFGFIMA